MNKNKPIIFLDQDGVTDDFVGGACKVHGRQSPYFGGGNTGVFEMISAWGMTKEQFWAPIDAMGEAFWLGLEKTPEADDIVGAAIDVAGKDGVAFLTAPSDDPSCVPGKRNRTAKNFPGIPVIFANAKDKRFLAGPGRYLFDDKDSNVSDFAKAGGVGITVPRPWNALHGRACWPHVKHAFDAIKQLYAAPVHAVPGEARGSVPGCGMAATSRQRGTVTVQRTASGITESYRPPARSHGRGFPSDDICLMSCSGCGAVYSSNKQHACHPDEYAVPC
jgi:hypothetical protein